MALQYAAASFNQAESTPMKKILAAAAIVIVVPTLGVLAFVAIGLPIQPCDAGPCLFRVR